MVDIFDNTILCNKCNTRMKKADVVKHGFVFRAVVCPKCEEKIIHPVDEQRYNRFKNLKNKEFRVKMRLVGNSYAVSIPKEIVSFMNEQHQRCSSRSLKNIEQEQEKAMNEMVKLCFEDMGRLSLNFNRK